MPSHISVLIFLVSLRLSSSMYGTICIILFRTVHGSFIIIKVGVILRCTWFIRIHVCHRFNVYTDWTGILKTTNNVQVVIFGSKKSVEWENEVQCISVLHNWRNQLIKWLIYLCHLALKYLHAMLIVLQPPLLLRRWQIHLNSSQQFQLSADWNDLPSCAPAAAL